MWTFKGVVLLIALFLLSACSATSVVNLSMAGKTLEKINAADVLTSKNVTAEYCISRRTLPFFWSVNMDEAVAKTLERAPGAVALSHVKITHKVNFYFVYSRVCTEVTGVPIYLQQSSS